MSKRVSQSWVTPVCWLVAGTGAAFIFALCGTVFLTPAHPQSEPIDILGDRADVGVVHVPATTLVHPAFVEAQPNMRQAREVPGQAIASNAVATEADSTSQATLAPPPLHQSALPPVQTTMHQTVPRVDAGIALDPAKTAPVVRGEPRAVAVVAPSSRPATVPALAPKQVVKAPDRDVETVVVTAAPYQQMALNIDGVGRGNSLVIQLPRVQRK